MATITTGSFPKALWPGIKRIWGRTYDELPVLYPKVYEVLSSDKAYEEMFEATGFGLAPVKSEAASTSYDSETQGPVTRFTNVAYALGFIVSREAMDDGRYAAVTRRRIPSLAFSMRQTEETVAWAVFNRAFNSSYTGGDGLELCSTAHVTVDGTQSNELTTASDLNEASLEDLLTNIMNARNSRGHQINLQGRCLVVPPALAFTAERIVKSNLQNDTANNAVNAVRSMGLLPDGVVVVPYLTDTDAWFVKTNAPTSMLKFDRTPTEFTRDNDFDALTQKAKAYMRFAVGWADWRGVYGSPGA